MDLALDDIPHDVEIDCQVAVHDSITKPSYVVPWDLRVGLLEGREALRRLSQGLKAVQGRVAKFEVTVQSSPAAE